MTQGLFCNTEQPLCLERIIMKQRLYEHKNKIIIALVIVITLTAAFFVGGVPFGNDTVRQEPTQIHSSSSEPISHEQQSDAVSEKSTSYQSLSSSELSSSEPSENGELSESHTSVDEISQFSELSAENPQEQSSFAQTSLVSETTSSRQSEESRRTELSKAPSVSSQPQEESSHQTVSSPTAEVSAASLYVPEEKSKSESAAPVGQHTCTIFISCETALKNEALNEKKRSLLPGDGIIIRDTDVSFSEGESVFDVLKRVCTEHKIHLEFSIIPLTGGAYIEGINNLYEFDCGSVSGWMYSVNGDFKNVGCSDCMVADGDRISWQYSCDLGSDIGNYYYGD